MAVEIAQHRPRSAADVEDAVVAVELGGDAGELEVVPLALDAAAAPVDLVVVPGGNALVVERLRGRR
jgi:hypothetical protein